MDNTSQTRNVEIYSVPRPAKTPVLKHLLIGLLVPLVIFLVGFCLLSAATLIGIIVVIVAIAITAGILMAALRINYQNNLDTEPAQWKTKTLPITSLVLIAGLAILIYFMFSR